MGLFPRFQIKFEKANDPLFAIMTSPGFVTYFSSHTSRHTLTKARFASFSYSVARNNS